MREAEPADVVTIMRESHGVWGGTMSVDAYQDFNLAQLTTTWGRTHYRFFVLHEGSAVEVGLKFYTLQLVAWRCEHGGAARRLTRHGASSGDGLQETKRPGRYE
jgi:hypothetical protein